MLSRRTYNCLSESRQTKKCLRELWCAKYTDSYSSNAFAKFQPGICSPLIHSIMSIDYASGQRRPWSDCVDTQVDLGIRCPHMLEDTFTHGATQLFTSNEIYHRENVHYTAGKQQMISTDCIYSRPSLFQLQRLIVHAKSKKPVLQNSATSGIDFYHSKMWKITFSSDVI